MVKFSFLLNLASFSK